MRPKATGSSKTASDLKKSADPGEWIDAFCVFLLSHAVLAKTVLASRRSRAAVGGVCLSADQFVPRISRALPFGNEHSATKHDQRDQGGQKRRQKKVRACIFAASPVAQASANSHREWLIPPLPFPTCEGAAHRGLEVRSTQQPAPMRQARQDRCASLFLRTATRAAIGGPQKLVLEERQH